MSEDLLRVSEERLTEPGSPTGDAAETEPEPEPEVYKPFKVFINHVDSYHSKYIAAVRPSDLLTFAINISLTVHH